MGRGEVLGATFSCFLEESDGLRWDALLSIGDVSSFPFRSRCILFKNFPGDEPKKPFLSFSGATASEVDAEFSCGLGCIALSYRVLASLEGVLWGRGGSTSAVVGLSFGGVEKSAWGEKGSGLVSRWPCMALRAGLASKGL